LPYFYKKSEVSPKNKFFRKKSDLERCLLFVIRQEVDWIDFLEGRI